MIFVISIFTGLINKITKSENYYTRHIGLLAGINTHLYFKNPGPYI